MTSPWPGAIAAGIAGLGAVLTVLAAVGMSFAVDIGPLHVSLRSVRNPAIAMVAGSVFAGWWLGAARLAGVSHHLETWLTRYSGGLAAVAAASLVLNAAWNGAFVAGGADSSGYLSQARLWNQASLRTPPPEIAGVTFREGARAVVPLGFRLTTAPDVELVPVYPPGLPLLMALFQRVFGAGAEYWVVPLAAGLLVCATYRTGRLLTGPVGGLLAALAIAASPTVLFQSLQPMSDVPAAAAWMAAVALVLESRPLPTLGGGLAAAAACVIRPNLFVLAPLLVLAAWRWESLRGRRPLTASLVAGPIAAAGLGLAAWQRGLYGGTTETGYGEISTLFQLAHVWPNLARYPGWLFETHGVFLLLGIAGPLLLRRGAAAPDQDRSRAVMAARWAALTCVVLVAFYLLYIPFDGWPYTRFLLPGLPLAVVLSVITLLAFVDWLPPTFRALGLLAILILVPSLLLSRARNLFVFHIAAAEQRYVDAAQYVGTLPQSAVLLSMHHSGSLAYYTGRPIVRWDWLDPAEFDAAVSAMAATRRDVYAVLDGWEVPNFQARFASSAAATLGTPIYGSVPAGNTDAVVFLVRPAAR